MSKDTLMLIIAVNQHTLYSLNKWQVATTAMLTWTHLLQASSHRAAHPPVLVVLFSGIFCGLSVICPPDSPTAWQTQVTPTSHPTGKSNILPHLDMPFVLPWLESNTAQYLGKTLG